MASQSISIKGRMVKVGQYDAYLTEATEDTVHKDSCILYISDVVGIWSESQARADAFAAKGYTTLMIDLFNGDRIDKDEFANVDLQDWIRNGRDGKGAHTPTEIDPVIVAAIDHARNVMGFSNIGAVGYSFGTRFLTRHYESGIQVGYLAYPTFLKEDELARVTGPISIAAAETDALYPVGLRLRSEEILKETGNVYQIVLYSGVLHGFYAAPHDVDKKHEKFAQEQSFAQAVAFFDTWLGKA